MKIAIIAKGMPPTIVGGAEKVTAAVVKHLKQRGHEVIIITKEWDIEKLNHSRPEMSHDIDFRWSKKAAKDAMNAKPDVIYVCQYWSEAAALFIEKVPTVLMAHDLGFLETGLDKLKPEIYKEIMDIWEKSLERADYVIVASPHILKQIKENFHIEENKISVIEEGIENGIAIKAKKERKTKQILFFGRIAPYKGIHNIIKAMPTILKKINAEFLVGGKVSTGWLGEYKKELDELIENLNIKDNVKFLGHIPEEEKLQRFREADVVVCSSIASEGFGIVPLEALKYNGIVVSSDLFLSTGVVNEDVAFVYQKNDVDALASAITKALLLSEDDKSQKRKDARKWLDKFTWKRHIEELEKIFLKLKSR